MEQPTEAFMRHLTASQPGIYSCILSLLPDRVAAQDVLQETNLTLWRKADDFEPGTNFMAWASRIARYHVLNHRRKLSRDRHVFDEDLFEAMVARQALRADDPELYSRALKTCLEKLPAPQRELVAERYAPGGAVKGMAETRGRTVGAISQMLYRIREALLNCISMQLRKELA